MYPYITILGKTLPSYGLCMAAGVGFALLLLLYTSRLRSISLSDALTCAIFAIVGGLAGAKILYLIVELPNLIADPSRLLGALTGGFVFYGGLIGGIVGGWLYTHSHKISFFDMADAAMPPVALGHAFGRLGCFLAGCCYGKACDSPFSVVFPEGSFAPAGIPILPTQLFESVFVFFLAAILFLILQYAKKPGRPMAWYLILYGVWRFFIEFLREDPRGAVGSLSTSQFISLFLIPAGILLLFVKIKPQKKNAPSAD